MFRSEQFWKAIDACIGDLDTLKGLRGGLDKIEKCVSAAKNGVNLADILGDGANLSSLNRVFGSDGLVLGLQLIARLATEDYANRSLTTFAKIDGKKKLDFLYRCFGGWSQFSGVISLMSANGSEMLFLNPNRSSQWANLSAVPNGTLCSFYVRSNKAKRDRAAEELALDRIEAAFEMLQLRAEPDESMLGPAMQIQSKAVKTPTRLKAIGPRAGAATASASTSPSATLRVVINKIDTFVHAGNGQLIVTHLRDYGGRVMMFVLRPEKKSISLDVDSIWSAEIRNGESLIFEFFGPKPSEEFIKELAKKVNKYTQMDKLVNE